MSKRINVNPDHYKVAGRERPGKGMTRAGISNRQSATTEARGRQRHPPLIPGSDRAADAGRRLERVPARQTSAKAGLRSSARKGAGRSRTR